MIRVKGLCKSFASQVVLDCINAEVRPGEYILLTGPNGAGKTTMMEIMLGLQRPTSGTVSMDDKPVSPGRSEIYRNMIYISHRTFLYDHLTGRENMELFVSLYGVVLRSGVVRGILEEVELWTDRDKLISQYSLGMRHRLSMGRLMVMEPRYIFMDEPQTGLDKRGQSILDRMVFQRFDSGSAVLEIGHDYNRFAELIQVFDRRKQKASLRIWLLKNGRIAKDIRAPERSDLVAFQEEVRHRD